MSTYHEHIKTHETKLDTLDPRHKSALTQLADALAHPFFTIKENGTGNTDARTTLYNKYVRVCNASGIPLPPMEKALLEAVVKKGQSQDPAKKTTNFLAQVAKRINEGKRPTQKSDRRRKKNKKKKERPKSPDLHKVNALFQAADYFKYSGYYIYQEALHAAINLELMEAGLEPIRDAAQTIPWEPTYQVGDCGTPMTTLILDDKVNEIAHTIANLAGWVNMTFLIQLHIPNREIGTWKKDRDPELLQNRINETTQMIIESEANILLLDEGLGDISGADLVAPLREKDPNLIIVGSSGGPCEEFKNAGLYTNIDKGQKPAHLRSAIRRWHATHPA